MSDCYVCHESVKLCNIMSSTDVLPGTHLVMHDTPVQRVQP